MYEKATLLDPTNEELLSQLFMAYVRIGAYKKQQNTALALYKVKAKTPYYFWAVMSVVLQAKEAGFEVFKAPAWIGPQWRMSLPPSFRFLTL